MTDQTPQDSCGCSCGGPGGKKGGWIIFLLALGFIFYVIFNSNTKQLDWITSYDEGLSLAREQNKPLMLTFESAKSQFCTDMRANTYPDREVVRFVSETFIPVLINADDDKSLLDLYSKEVNNYFPSHVIKYADNAYSRTIFGYDPPQAFIKKLNDALATVNDAIAEN